MIRQATADDINRIMEILEVARQFMRDNGNGAQWNNGYPSLEVINEDLNRDELYVMTDPQEDERIYALFVLAKGEDPSYEKIYEGNWHSNEPYVTIHRVASDGTHKGIMKDVREFAVQQCNHVRIDTHEDNLPMRTAVTKLGWQYCGTIYIADGSPRFAYDLIVE